VRQPRNKKKANEGWGWVITFYPPCLRPLSQSRSPEVIWQCLCALSQQRKSTLFCRWEKILDHAIRARKKTEAVVGENAKTKP
jgi:hypothetical protein